MCTVGIRANTRTRRRSDTGRKWVGEVVPLEPVDSVSITTVCDNVIDFWLLDQVPLGVCSAAAARRPPSRP